MLQFLAFHGAIALWMTCSREFGFDSKEFQKFSKCFGSELGSSVGEKAVGETELSVYIFE